MSRRRVSLVGKVLAGIVAALLVILILAIVVGALVWIAAAIWSAILG